MPTSDRNDSPKDRAANGNGLWSTNGHVVVLDDELGLGQPRGNGHTNGHGNGYANGHNGHNGLGGQDAEADVYGPAEADAYGGEASGDGSGDGSRDGSGYRGHGLEELPLGTDGMITRSWFEPITRREPSTGDQATTNGHDTSGFTTSGFTTNGFAAHGHVTDGHVTNGRGYRTEDDGVDADAHEIDLEPYARRSGAGVQALTGRGAGDGAPAAQPTRTAVQPKPSQTTRSQPPGRVAMLSLLVTVVVLLAAAVTAVNRFTDTGTVAVPTGPAEARPDIVRHWNAMTLQAIRDDASAPTVAARALAIVHTSMYDAWAAYDDSALGTRFGDQLRRPSSEQNDANKQEAISYAAFHVLTDLYPDQARLFEAEMRHLGYAPEVGSVGSDTPAGVGLTAAAAVLEFRHHDGANQLGDLAPGAYSDYTGYQPVNRPDSLRNPNRWQPLTIPTDSGEPQVQQFATPHWARVAPFALQSPDQFRPAGPAPMGSAELEGEIDELLRLSAELDDRDKAIVQYWADGPGTETPAGHWAQFAQWVSQRDQLSMDDEAKLFFALANAGLDASIVAWDAKVTFDNARPVTVIAAGLGGTQVEAWAGPYQASRWIQAEDWRPYQPATSVTPPFPDYLSGHSVFSSASATILRAFTGSDEFGAEGTVRSGSSKVEPGVVPHQDVVLSWPTFTDAANEAGWSRMLGGIHFRSAVEDGRLAGVQVGEAVWAQAQELFNGSGATDPI